MPGKLGYWQVRGICEPIRYVLYYAGADFEDYRYKIGYSENFEEVNTVVKAEWMKEKFSHGLDFPNLPYYMDGDVKMSQSMAILRHVARKYNLFPYENEAMCDMVEQHGRDVQFNLIVYSALDANFGEESADKAFIEKQNEKIKMLSDFLGQKDWFFENRVTYIDFVVYEALDFNRFFNLKVLEGFPNLKAFFERVKNLPKIKEYLESDTFVKWPLFGSLGRFGGRGPCPEYCDPKQLLTYDYCKK